jgi:uncharacterized RDD family membrane protein YckC
MDPTSVMGKRIGAFFIDLFIAWAAAIAFFFTFSESRSVFGDPCGTSDSPVLCFYADGTVRFAEGGDAAAIILMSMGVWFLLQWIIPTFTGGSPGKLMVGLRVVDQHSGQLAGTGKHLVRALFLVLDQIPFFLIGLITSVSSKGHRRVGDMVASTFVIHKTLVGAPPIVPGLTAAADVFTPAPPGSYAPPAQGMAPTPGAPAPPPPAFRAPAPAPPVVPAEDGVDAPKWDSDRNAYIQWDPELKAWMQFDDAAQKWKPITQ